MIRKKCNCNYLAVNPIKDLRRLQYYLRKQEEQLKELPKLRDDRNNWLPGQSPIFFCNIGASISTCRPRISDRHFWEVGNFEKLSYLVLTEFSSHCLLCPAGPVWTVHCSKCSLLPKWLAFAIKKTSSTWRFFDSHHLLLKYISAIKSKGIS